MSDRPLQPARNPPEAGFFDYFPIFRFFRFVFRGFKRRVRDGKNSERNMFGRKRKGPIVESNVPFEITLYLQSYNAWLLRNGLLQPAIATGIMNNISTLQDTLANLDRIGNTPLPFAYQAHLRLSLWYVVLVADRFSFWLTLVLSSRLYLFLLPVSQASSRAKMCADSSLPTVPNLFGILVSHHSVRSLLFFQSVIPTNSSPLLGQLPSRPSSSSVSSRLVKKCTSTPLFPQNTLS